MVKVKEKPKPITSKYDQDFGPSFQRHILAVAARVPGFVERCRAVLDHRYFVSDAHRSVAQALLEHVDDHKRLPTKPTLTEDLRRLVGSEDMELVEATLAEIYKEPVHDSAAVEGMVVAFGKRQAMLNAVLEGAERIDKGDPGAVEGIIRKAMLVGEDLTKIGTDFAKSLSARASAYRSPEKDNDARIPTGIAHLDHMMKGGLKRGTLGVLLAPPKRGKTTCLVNIGYSALTDLDGLNVFHYTLEMDEMAVLRRYDARLMGNLVRQRRDDPDGFTTELQKRVQNLVHGRLVVKEYPTRSATVDMIRSNLSIHTAQGFSPDLVIVDYAGIMKASQRRAGEYRHEQASIFEDLRALAGEFNCAVWSAQQANRGALDKETVTMADTAETFESAAVADAMIALCQTSDEQADGVCRLFGAAMREVESEWTIECRIRREECRITSTSIEDSSKSRVYAPFDKDSESKPDGEDGNSKKQKLAKARRVGGVSKPAAKKLPHKVRNSVPSKKVPK